jgi:uncharacterized protein YfeS
MIDKGPIAKNEEGVGQMVASYRPPDIMSATVINIATTTNQCASSPNGRTEMIDMEIHCYRHSYDTYGASCIYSFVADLLTIRLDNYGNDIESIELFAHLRSPIRNPRPTLEGLFDEFHEYLKRLPTITFRRNRKRVEIRFLSKHIVDTDDDEWKPSADQCNIAAGEVATALQLLKKRIKPTDEFDIERFLADAKELLSKKIDSIEEWEAIEQKAKKKRQTIRAKKNPWELLDIDWSHYHTRAREVLDDPFYWECTNDLAPNGSDGGDELLESFRRWDLRHCNQPPLRFLERLMKRWGIEPIDWNITDARAVRKLKKDVPIPLSVCNEAAIALAFAVIKLRATCPPEIVRMALNALKRTAVSVKDSDLSDEVKARWKAAIAKMRTKLQSFAVN